MATCWECGTEVRRVMTVKLADVGREIGPFRLCTSCYQSHYLPLITGGPAASERKPGPQRELTGAGL
jgi:hypothetical protein